MTMQLPPPGGAPPPPAGTLQTTESVATPPAKSVIHPTPGEVITSALSEPGLPQPTKGGPMNQENEEMRPEYDIRGGVRGKYLSPK